MTSDCCSIRGSTRTNYREFRCLENPVGITDLAERAALTPARPCWLRLALKSGLASICLINGLRAQACVEQRAEKENGAANPVTDWKI